MEQAASGSCGLTKIARMSRADVAAAGGEPVGRAGGRCRASDRCVAARTSVSSADEVLELLLGLADPAGSASVGCKLARVAARLDRIPLGGASAVERRAVER
jgi:hypothetical protein